VKHRQAEFAKGLRRVVQVEKYLLIRQRSSSEHCSILTHWLKKHANWGSKVACLFRWQTKFYRVGLRSIRRSIEAAHYFQSRNDFSH